VYVPAVHVHQCRYDPFETYSVSRFTYCFWSLADIELGMPDDTFAYQKYKIVFILEGLGMENFTAI
jgi:hypothetical protein